MLETVRCFMTLQRPEGIMKAAAKGLLEVLMVVAGLLVMVTEG